MRSTSIYALAQHNSRPALWLGLAIIMLLAFPTLAAASIYHQEAEPTATVVVASLNVRSGPGTNHNRIGGVKQGDRLIVLGQINNCAWLRVRTLQNLEGWVSGAAQYVTLSVTCVKIPVTGTQIMITPTATLQGPVHSVANPTSSTAVKEVGRHTVYDITFIIELDTTGQSNQYSMRAEGPFVMDTQRHGVGEIFEVTNRFPVQLIANKVTEDLTELGLNNGVLAAVIDPMLNPETEGIQLALRTTGKLSWCGESLSALDPKAPFVFLQTLKWNSMSTSWYLNWGPGMIEKILPSVEERGWIEASWVGIFDPSKEKKKGEPLPPMHETFVLHASEDYSLEYLPNVVTEIGEDTGLLLGREHEYLVRGYICKTNGNGIFSPTQQLKMIYVKKIK